MDVRFCDESGVGVGWIAAEPAFMMRASHALRVAEGVWLVDPVDGTGVVDRIHELGPVLGVVQLLDRHGRDCAALAARFGVPHHVTPQGPVPGSPFEGIRVRSVPGWRETALWWPQERVLVVADALGTAPYFRGPEEPIGVHPFMRLAPPRRLAGLGARQVLVGHGEGLIGEQAGAAADEALATARRRAPAWLAKVVRPGGRK